MAAGARNGFNTATWRQAQGSPNIKLMARTGGRAQRGCEHVLMAAGARNDFNTATWQQAQRSPNMGKTGLSIALLPGNSP